MILAAILACIAYAFRLERQGSPRGADAAVTCGVLIFGAGLALVGQMYHLPADWPADGPRERRMRYVPREA